mmetsp:Transcript_828/g.1166  ORF Transcript_828/g.1166 Transcript_828/m.1166 type:complete len:259 (+) Transcript_828:93-869(+)
MKPLKLCQRRISTLMSILVAASLSWLVKGFSPHVHNMPLGSQGMSRRNPPVAFFLAKTDGDSTSWLDLVENGGVQKMLVEEGFGDPYSPGSVVSIDYSGSIVASDWTAEEVVTCWLHEQQGLHDLTDKFRELQLDRNRLTDLEYFTEDFVRGQLGVEAKIASKKLVMAAKRLVKTQTDANEYPLPGTIFDSNHDYQITLGKGKVIQGMQVGVASMKKGEKAKIKIRSDFGYGGEGCRKNNGDILVPPFATLCFDIELK